VVAAFDAVSDPGNLGAMVRTCDWFGVNGILVGRDSVDLYNPKVVRSTMGGIFHLPIAVGMDLPGLIPRAKKQGYTVYVTDARGDVQFDRVSFAGRSLLVFGNEAWGVSDQVGALADVRLAIRRYGAAESLNVSVACGVILAMLRRLPG
jgi:TrmH family RNA methyltransferase